MKKAFIRSLSCLLSVVVVIGIFTTSQVLTVYAASPNQTANFNKNYTVVPDNPGQTVVNIAQAQIGKNGYDLPYGEDWCADFVSDCAELAGQSAAVPRHGRPDYLDGYIIGAGGYEVSKEDAKPGDIAFYDFNSNYSPDHVEIVYSVSGNTVKTIGGNTGNDNFNYATVCNPRNPGSLLYIIRPNYKLTIKDVSNIYPVDSTYIFLKSVEGYAEQCFWDVSQWTIGYGNKCPHSHSADGSYYGQKGGHYISEDDARSLFTEKLTSYVNTLKSNCSGLKMNQNQFDALLSATYNHGNVIYCPLKYYLQGSLTASEARTQYLEWCINEGTITEQGLRNRRKKEADLFFSDINTDNNDYFEGDNPYPEPSRNLYVNYPNYLTGNDVKWVQWCLVKLGYANQNDSNFIDGIYGDITARTVEQFQRNNELTVDGICGENTRNMLKKRVDELDNQKPDATYVNVQAGTHYTPTSLWWNKSDKAEYYDVKIWKGTYWQGDPYLCVWGVKDTSCMVDLSEGYYEAYVDCVNSVGCTMSENVVKFNVSIGVARGQEIPENEAAGNTIPDGDYYIVNEINQDYFVDIPGNDFNTTNGQNVQMWGWGSSLPPREGYDCFHFEYLNNGFYKIRQINTNMCIDVAGGSLDNGTNVQMCQDNGNTAQQWSIEKTSHGYRIRSRCNGYFLDVVDGNHECGTNLRCWEGNDSKAQSFSFIPRDLNEQPILDGVYIIKTNVNREHILDIAGNPGQFYSGSNVQIWTSINNTIVEQYIIKYVGDGWYKIFEKTSGLIVEFANPDTTFLNNWDKPRNVQLAEDNGGKNQLWKIRKNSDGTYFVINKANGYYLDLENSWLDDGSNVSECTYNGSNAQRWIFEIGAYTICYNMNDGDGYIDNQIKNYGQDIILSGVYPTRTGYDFVGWNTDPNATTAQYQPNGQFSYNGDTTLFAVWKPKQIDVTFYRNHDGNDNVIDTQTFIYGINGQFFSDKYWSKDGCTLLGWSFDRNAKQESYNVLCGVANEWINAHTPNVNLYAIWRDDIKPFASNAIVDKISSRGYRVTCNIGDNVGVTKVLFAVWTDYAGQDDLVWHEGTISGNIATVYIEASQHNNESGSYSVEIYPYDANENFGYYKLENIFLSDIPQKISSVDYNKHTYVLYASDKSWTDAEAWCEQNGGYLATINNQEEWNKVKELLGTINATPCWLGAESTSGSFKWVTGEPFNFSDWHEGQPDTWDGHEFYLGTGYSGLNCYRWNDFTIAAYDIGGFVYEKPYTYTISYDSNGGEGSIPSSETYFGGKFKLAPCSFSKTGYTFANAYNVCRKSDNKWYTSQGWFTEEDINRLGYIKWSYPQEEEHIINDVWTDGASNNDTYTFYAVWDSIIDFGENFYATISETDNGMYITNTNGHFYGKEKDNSNDQIWYFEKHDNWYYIKSCSDGQYLDVLNEKDENGAKIQVCRFTNSNAQRWYIFGTQNSYYIRPIFSAARTLDMYDTEDIHLWYKYDVPVQKFTITKTDEVHNYYVTDSKDATCSEEGYNIYTCNICGKSYTENIAKKSHSYTSKVISPTTTAQGYTLHTCSVCGHSYKDNYTDKLVEQLVNNSVISAEMIKLGETVTANAKATGGTGEYLYQVVYKQTTQSKWTTAQSYKANSTVTIKPASATTYDVCIKVKDSNNTEVKKYFTVKVINELKNNSTISKTEITLGDTITVNGKATGGTGSYQYNILYKQTAQSKWTTVQSYKANATATFKPGKATNYDVCVKVKDSDGTEVKKFFTVMVKNAELKNTSTLSAETINLGETVTTNAKATGGTAPYQYNVLYKQTAQTKWTTVQSYKANATVTFKPGKATAYDVCVKVKDSTGTEVKKYFTVNVTSNELKNISTVSAETINLGESITVNAKATGSTGFYTYAVYYKKTSDTKWVTAQDFKANNKIIIKPTKATTYDICIKIKDDKGTIDKKYFKVNVIDFVNTSAISATEIKLGETVNVNCSATGSTGFYQYAVYYKKTADTKWTTKQSYSSNNAVTIKPTSATTYDICVKVKDNQNNEAKKYFTVTVK